MLVTCVYCGQLHERGFICPSKPKYVKKITHIEKFRNSKAWKLKRDSIKRRDNYICLVCYQDMIVVYDNLSVHHIDPLCENFDKRLDDKNLITVCNCHHEDAEIGRIERSYLKELVKDR